VGNPGPLLGCELKQSWSIGLAGFDLLANCRRRAGQQAGRLEGPGYGMAGHHRWEFVRRFVSAGWLSLALARVCARRRKLVLPLIHQVTGGFEAGQP